MILSYLRASAQRCDGSDWKRKASPSSRRRWRCLLMPRTDHKRQLHSEAVMMRAGLRLPRRMTPFRGLQLMRFQFRGAHTMIVLAFPECRFCVAKSNTILPSSRMPVSRR